MTDFWEPPEEYHVLVQGGVTFFIDQPTRRSIEQSLYDGNGPRYAYTIAGECVTIIQAKIEALFDSTPESRRREHALRERNENEFDGEARK